MGTVKNVLITVAFSFMLAAFVPIGAQEIIEDKVIDLEAEQSHAKNQRDRAKFERDEGKRERDEGKRERDKGKGERGHINARLTFLESEIVRLEALIGQVNWTDILNRPIGLDDGDDNTQLNETQVDAFVANNNFSIGSHTVDTDTQLDLAGVMALGFDPGSHTVVDPNIESRLVAIEAKDDPLDFMSMFSDTLLISGINVQIVSGSGSTDDGGVMTGLGNLTIGYNEPRITSTGDIRTGSHNLILGSKNDYSSFGGAVFGFRNTISNDYAEVLGGNNNTASGRESVVAGGSSNIASGNEAVVAGGNSNIASGLSSVVAGGNSNMASGGEAVVAGGSGNISSGLSSVVSGGSSNIASGESAVVAGGSSGIADTVGDTAVGTDTSSSGMAP